MIFITSKYNPNSDQSVYTAVEVLQAQDIPHNMMITYGDPCNPADTADVPEPVLRVCLWPVKPSDEVRTGKELKIFFSGSL